jgi:hypothetical protein
MATTQIKTTQAPQCGHSTELAMKLIAVKVPEAGALIRASTSKLLNGNLPASIDRCVEIIEIAKSKLVNPDLRTATQFAKQLVSSRPDLDRKGIDLSFFSASLVKVFEAHSIAAAMDILDPVSGLVGCEDFLSLPKINLALELFEREQHSIANAAEWVVFEHKRRASLETKKQELAGSAERFTHLHGKSPVQVAMENMEAHGKI